MYLCQDLCNSCIDGSFLTSAYFICDVFILFSIVINHPVMNLEQQPYKLKVTVGMHKIKENIPS